MEVKIGKRHELSATSLQCITVAGHQLVLIYQAQTFFALDNACPHKQAYLCEGDLNGEFIACPWHGAKFSIANGKSFSPLALGGVKSWPVILRDDDVYIRMLD